MERPGGRVRSLISLPAARKPWPRRLPTAHGVFDCWRRRRLAAIAKFGVTTDKISYISTGGGAFLNSWKAKNCRRGDSGGTRRQLSLRVLVGCGFRYPDVRASRADIRQ